MLNKNKSHRTGLWKYGFSAPLFVLMLIFSAATANPGNNVLSIAAKRNLPIADIISDQKIYDISQEVNSQSLNMDIKSLNKESVPPESGQSKPENLPALKKLIERNIKTFEAASNRDTIPVRSKNEIKDFSKVDVLPEFPGGMKGWGEYLQTALRYPAEAKKLNITGRVILSFIVQKDGSITDIKVLRGIGGGMDEEAIRVVNESPKWKPGLVKGEPVNVAYTMPIVFKLPAKNTEETTN